MDPITAFVQLIKAMLEFATEAMKGQSPEQKQKIWQWFIDDREKWRKRLRINDDEDKK